MSNLDIKSVREELVQALSRKFDDSKKLLSTERGIRRSDGLLRL